MLYSQRYLTLHRWQEWFLINQCVLPRNIEPSVQWLDSNVLPRHQCRNVRSFFSHVLGCHRQHCPEIRHFTARREAFDALLLITLRQFTYHKVVVHWEDSLMVQNHLVPLIVCSVDRAGVIEYLVYGVRRFSAVEVDRVFACFDQQIQNAHEFDAEIIYPKNKSIKIYHCLINGCASLHFLSLNFRFLVCNWGGVQWVNWEKTFSQKNFSLKIPYSTSNTSVQDIYFKIIHGTPKVKHNIVCKCVCTLTGLTWCKQRDRPYVPCTSLRQSFPFTSRFNSAFTTLSLGLSFIARSMTVY